MNWVCLVGRMKLRSKMNCLCGRSRIINYCMDRPVEDEQWGSRNKNATAPLLRAYRRHMDNAQRSNVRFSVFILQICVDQKIFSRNSTDAARRGEETKLNSNFWPLCKVHGAEKANHSHNLLQTLMDLSMHCTQFVGYLYPEREKRRERERVRERTKWHERKCLQHSKMLHCARGRLEAGELMG